MEDAAQVIQGGGIYRQILPQLVDGGTGDVVIFDQRVCGFLGIAQGFPKPPVNDHFHHLCSVDCIYSSLLFLS